MKRVLLGGLLFGLIAGVAGAPPAIPEAAWTGTRAGRRLPPEAEQALERLVKQRQELLNAKPESVVWDKPVLPPGATARDYVSFGTYWWPNPKTANGLPYIRKDGLTNPDAQKGDGTKMWRMRKAVQGLALLYAFTGDETAAARAVELLRIFFLDEATGMRPHLNYGQGIPGIEDGRPIGIIDTYQLLDVADAIGMLEDSKAMTPEIRAGLGRWFGAYAVWLQEPKNVAALGDSPSNIGVAYHAQIIAFAKLSGDLELARTHARKLVGIIPRGISPDGILTHEISRTRSWDYTVYALGIFLNAALLSRDLGVDLVAARQPGHGSIGDAVNFAATFLDHEKNWPYPQLNPPIRRQALAPILVRMHFLTGSETYAAALRSLPSPGVDPVTALFFSSVR